MEELKSLFGEGSLSYGEFEQKLSEAGDTIKLANLKSGAYVDKAKYEKMEKSSTDWQTKYSALSENAKNYDELQSKYDALVEEHTALKSQVDSDKKMNMVLGAKVNPKFAKFVIGEVSAQVDDKKDFQTALGEYLKDNKEFVIANKGTFTNLEQGGNLPKTNNEIMNDLIRKGAK